MITFKSRATSSVMMFDDVGKQLLEIMGKTHDLAGIITLEQLPDAIKALRRAADEDRARAWQHKPDEDQDDNAPRGPASVSLAQRAVPLINMMVESLQAREPVIWG